MKFKAPGDMPVHLALVTGHTAQVGTEFAELDARFHREAIAQGCIAFGTSAEEKVENDGLDRRQVIAEAINAMLDGSDEEDFTKSDGKPNLQKLSARVGFTVDRSERDAIWAEIAK